MKFNKCDSSQCQLGVKTKVRLPCDECRMHVSDMEEELVE